LLYHTIRANHPIPAKNPRKNTASLLILYLRHHSTQEGVHFFCIQRRAAAVT
jgi:hypothetical protein